MDHLHEFIRDTSSQMGFVDMGIIPVMRSEHFESYSHWLSAGYSAGMTYLSTTRALECRQEPLRLFPLARAIIVVMARYPARKEIEPPSSKLLDRISTYAWGRDYHVVIREKLERLATALQTQLDQPLHYFISVDGGPLLERELAATAGLGWIGRNSSLISPTFGSFTFLGEMLIDLPVQTECTLVPDRCGHCTRCIEACPTGCILPDRTIDARKCISYLTIENRGDISEQLRDKLGGWVFGCDICQAVCPWNQKTGDHSVDTEFQPSLALKGIDMVGELSLTPDTFKARYYDSPIRRARWMGYLRNIVLAVGHYRIDAAMRELLLLEEKETDPVIRSSVRWAIERLSVR